jgi:uncharacterized membrane protein YGL010W
MELRPYWWGAIMQPPDAFVSPLEVGYLGCVRTANQWLSDYGESHRNPANKALHWICVPVILWCLLGLSWVTPFPSGVQTALPTANWATVAVLAALVYYAFLSMRLAIGVLPLLLLMLWSIDALDHRAHSQLWMVCAALFVLAWIGQFIGHAIEGKRPSFFKDLQFLMIGPLWLLADAYRRLGIRY